MIQLERVAVNCGDFTLAPVDLTVPSGSYMTLLGPTGAGKSVLLEAIMGLQPLATGRILLHSRDVSGLPPEARQISYLPQDLALFPHLSVRDNILFGARARALETQRVTRQFNDLVELLNIGHLLERTSVKTLSGGEQQRVALARALLPEPRLLLLDEPFSALDAWTRNELQRKLRTINAEFGVTLLHVTHERDEAFMLGETIAVLIDGRLCQTGSHDDLYYHPASLAVARLLLNQNIFSMTVKDQLANGDLLLEGPLMLQSRPFSRITPGDKVHVGIRGEEIIILRPDRAVPDWLKINRFQGRVVQIFRKGGYHTILVHLNEQSQELELEIPNCAFRDLDIESGSDLDLCLKKNAIWVIGDSDKE
jgi:ABC-type Fe3+/spermidine/putrescine transport system ATPase subunit